MCRDTTRAASRSNYRMFRTELRKFGRLYQLAATISRPKTAFRRRDRRPGPSRQRLATGKPAPVTTFCGRRPDPARPSRRRSGARFSMPCGSTGGWCSAARSRDSGRRIGGSRPFISYPHFLLFIEALGSFGIAVAFAEILEALGIPGPAQAMAAAAALFVATLGTLLKYTENLTYLLYLLCDTIWTWEFSHRQRPEWDQRIDRFCAISHGGRAQQRCRGNRRRRSQFGDRSWESRSWHGRSSSIPPSDSMARASSLLTIGGNFPIVGFHAAAQDFAIICGSSRWNLRSTGSTASRART